MAPAAAPRSRRRGPPPSAGPCVLRVRGAAPRGPHGPSRCGSRARGRRGAVPAHQGPTSPFPGVRLCLCSLARTQVSSTEEACGVLASIPVCSPDPLCGERAPDSCGNASPHMCSPGRWPSSGCPGIASRSGRGCTTAPLCPWSWRCSGWCRAVASAASCGSWTGSSCPTASRWSWSVRSAARTSGTSWTSGGSCRSPWRGGCSARCCRPCGTAPAAASCTATSRPRTSSLTWPPARRSSSTSGAARSSRTRSTHEWQERQSTALQSGSSSAATTASQPPSGPWASCSMTWSVGTFLSTPLRTSSGASSSSHPACLKSASASSGGVYPWTLQTGHPWKTFLSILGCRTPAWPRRQQRSIPLHSRIQEPSKEQSCGTRKKPQSISLQHRGEIKAEEMLPLVPGALWREGISAPCPVGEVLALQ